MALALPDICAALETPNRPVGERYKDWFNRYLKPKYDPSTMYEQVEADAPNLLIRMSEETINRLKNQPRPDSAGFSAEDCYRLRCKCLHQGLPERMGADRIHFTAPDPTGRVQIHKNTFDGTWQLSVDQFCIDVADAVTAWWSGAKTNPEISGRAENLIKIYALDDSELPIVRYTS